MKRSIVFSFLALTAISVTIWLVTRPPAVDKGTKSIAIVSIVKIEPITQLEDGFKQTILASDFAKSTPIIFTYENAQGDASLQNLIVDKIIRKRPSLVYVLGTPIAIAIQKRDPNLIIVQGAATDPIDAGLANSWNGSGRNYAATTDLPPVAIQMDLIRELIPKITSLGLIYNAGEANSVAVVRRIREYILNQKLSLKLEERGVANSSEIATAVASLNSKVQAIYIPPDNTVHAGLRVVCKVASEIRIPVFTSVESSIDDGALAALALDYFKLGEQSAKIALRILQDQQKAGDIPIAPIDSPKIVINQRVANDLNIDLTTVSQRTNIEIRKKK